MAHLRSYGISANENRKSASTALLHMNSKPLLPSTELLHLNSKLLWKPWEMAQL